MLVLSAAGACTSTRRLRSSLYLPCGPKAITISAETSAPGQDTWVASCRGADYGCSATAAGNKVIYACKLLRNAADAGALEGSVPDGSIPDAAVPDGLPDGSIPDAAVLGRVLDDSVPDMGIPDGSLPDAGVPDVGVPDRSARTDASPESTGWSRRRGP